MFKCGDCAASVHTSVFDCCINHCTYCSGLLNIQYVIRVLGFLNCGRICDKISVACFIVVFRAAISLVMLV